LLNLVSDLLILDTAAD